METLFFGLLLIIIAAVILFSTHRNAHCNEKKEYLYTGFVAGVLFLTGIAFNSMSIDASPAFLQEECEKHSICYELVQTIAENTNYTEKQITDFFIIVSDDIEAWDAIKMLDSSLTDEQINAIMEISEMKQAE